MKTVQDKDTKKLFELIRDTKMCMLATADAEGNLRSRPMATQSSYEDTNLYFFTDKNSGKVDEIRSDAAVNVSYEDTGKNHYVSVSGRASLSEDKELMKKFWNPAYKAWFPEGLDDPSISLLKITIEKAEYWDSPSSTVVQIIGFAKAALTGQKYQPNEGHKKFDHVVQ